MIPCPDRRTAETVAQVIRVDRELRPEDVRKEMRVEECCGEGVTLLVYVEALSPCSPPAPCTHRRCGICASP